MPKVIAKAEIHRTIKPGKAATATSPAVKPEIEIIAPGTAFISEGEELAALRRSRAVIDPEGSTAAAVPSAQAEDAPAPAAKTKKKATNTRKPATSKPKSAPAASDDKGSDLDDAGDEDKNDGTEDGGDGNEGDDDANLV